jgi:sugar lactone lactonase YvrE
MAATPQGQLFVADVGGKISLVNPEAHSAKVVRVALNERFPQVSAMTSDAEGRILLVDRHSILRWNPASDKLEVVGGSRRFGFSGENLVATEATFKWPQGIVTAKGGDIFVSDTENCRVRRISVGTGVVVTIAGTGECESSGDSGQALTAHLSNPSALTIDGHQNLFVSEGCRVRKIDSAGAITTYAGTGECGFSGDGADAGRAKITATGLAVDQKGNLYISDYAHNRIRRIDATTHVITTVAGNGYPNRVDIEL